MFTPAELAEHIRQHLREDRGGIAEHLTALRDADVADVLNNLSRCDAADVLALLPADRAASLANEPSLSGRGAMFAEMEPSQAASLLNELASDQRAEVLRQMSPHDRGRLLPKLPAAARAEAEQLLSYPERSAGAIMTTEYVKLSSTMSVADALREIRGVARDRETIYACYVLDAAGKLLGAVSLRDLVVAEPDKTVGEIMQRNPIVVKVTDDRDEAARRIGKYNLLAVPVLDAADRLAGFVTVDDVIDVMIEEQTNQVLRMGGVEAGALDDPYLTSPFLLLVRKRAVWLVILFLSEMLTATAMGFFEKEIERAVVLALFVPLIISSGGNSGSQAASLLIRALALQEVRLRDWWRVFRRELASGLLLGILLGAIGFLRIAVWIMFKPTLYGDHWIRLGATVSVSLVGIITWGTISGSMLPFVLKKLGADPATSSAPFVATLVDVTGLIIYFSVALVILL